MIKFIDNLVHDLSNNRKVEVHSGMNSFSTSLETVFDPHYPETGTVTTLRGEWFTKIVADGKTSHEKRVEMEHHAKLALTHYVYSEVISVLIQVQAVLHYLNGQHGWIPGMDETLNNVKNLLDEIELRK